MKDFLAGFMILVFIGVVTFAVVSEGKKNQFKQWCNVSISFSRKHVLEREAKINDIDPDFARAIIWVESRGDSTAVSKTGCKGIAQINRGNSVVFGHPHDEMHDDEKALPVMFRLIRESKNYWEKNIDLKKQEPWETWVLREYSKGRRIASRNFLAGKSYARLVLEVYRAIKAGKFEEAKLSKINGEA